MAAQVEELDGIADLPPSKELADRLRNTVTSVREAATKMDRNLGELVARVDSANERIAALEKELNEARERALYDSLTRVYSRAALDERLALAVREGEAKGPWSFMIADIDHFKGVNDQHGHIVGDALLYKIARVMEKTLNGRVQDAILARYGGEEFSAIMPRSTLPKATQVAELLRRTVEASRWQCRTANGSPVVQTTVSFGVAQYRDGDTVSSLVERADRALYKAKEGGRNRVAASEK
jgi:diguanylate cyclase